MQIVSLSNETSLADLASRVYGLKAKDPRLAQASAALTTANPSLAGDIGKLAPGTPIVVPALASLSIGAVNKIAPELQAVSSILNQLSKSVQQAAAAQAAGVTDTTRTAQAPGRSAAINVLHEDIAAFLKTHS
jgi:hypothetical protein